MPHAMQCWRRILTVDNSGTSTTQHWDHLETLKTESTNKKALKWFQNAVQVITIFSWKAYFVVNEPYLSVSRTWCVSRPQWSGDLGRQDSTATWRSCPCGPESLPAYSLSSNPTRQWSDHHPVQLMLAFYHRLKMRMEYDRQPSSRNTLHDINN